MDGRFTGNFSLAKINFKIIAFIELEHDVFNCTFSNKRYVMKLSRGITSR